MLTVVVVAANDPNERMHHPAANYVEVAVVDGLNRCIKRRSDVAEPLH